MRVAVTGVSGYLGGLILRRLDAAADVETILGIDLAAPDFGSRKFEYVRADVREADFASLLRGADVLFHLAFIVQPPKGMPMKVIDEINVDGSRRVFEGARAAGVPKIICASSTAAYGAHPDNTTPLTEDSPLRPNGNWYYSRTKAKVEACLDEFQSQNPNVTVIRLRPCIFLGPCINNSMGDLFSAPVLMSVSRDVKIDFAWDADVADAFILAMRHGESGIFNLVGDGPLSMEDMARLSGRPVLRVNHRLLVSLFRLGHALGLQPQGAVEWMSAGTTCSINASARKARDVLGWNPRYDAAGAYVEFLKCKKEDKHSQRILRESSK